MVKFRELLNLVQVNGLEEAIKMVNKKWNLSLKDWTIQVNDNIDHNILDRIYSRTNLKTVQFQQKLQVGLDYIDKKYQKGKIQKDCMIGIHYTKSNFIVLFLVKPENKYIRISTVLDSDMVQKGTIKWELNEFNTTNAMNLEWALNESGPDLDLSILVESYADKISVHYNFDDCYKINL